MEIKYLVMICIGQRKSGHNDGLKYQTYFLKTKMIFDILMLLIIIMHALKLYAWRKVIF